MKNLITEETNYVKHLNNLSAETITTVNGNQFKITTAKSNNGMLYSTVLSVVATKNVIMFNASDVFNKIVLIESRPTRVTENILKVQHSKAILLFDEKVESGEIKAETKGEIEIGTIIFLDGYGKNKESQCNSHIVYAIEESNWGKNYLTVEQTTLKLKVNNGVREYKNKFGIGNYWEQGYVYNGTKEDLESLVIVAKEKDQHDRDRKASEQLLLKNVRAEKIEQGKSKITIPASKKAVIVAEDYTNESDSQSDYFNARVSKFVILAFSDSDRNNMHELKRASLNFEETADFGIREKEGKGDYYSKIVASTREHSILPNYFLGSEAWEGWKVSKSRYLTDDEVYIAVEEGRYFVPQVEKLSVAGPANSEELSIVDYSEKAFALIGNTKPIKEELTKLGGRFNFRLSCGAGWIFPKSKLQTVKAAFQL